MNEKNKELELELGEPRNFVDEFDCEVVEFLFDINREEDEFAVDVFYSYYDDNKALRDERDESLTSHFSDYNEAYSYAQLLSAYFTGTVETRITDNTL